jgi:acyl-coenzyme A synthetase/AMP-(fatty) acid ligase
LCIGHRHNCRAIFNFIKLATVARIGHHQLTLCKAFGPKAIEHRIQLAQSKLVVTDTGNRSKLDEIEMFLVIDLKYGRLLLHLVILESWQTDLTTLLIHGRYIVTIFAAWRIGAVYQPLFTAFGPKAIEHRIQLAQSKLVVTK